MNKATHVMASHVLPLVRSSLAWSVRQWKFTLCVVTLELLCYAVDYTTGLLLVLVHHLGLVSVIAGWRTYAPRSYARLVAVPLTRHRWRTWARSNWQDLAEQCGLAVKRRERAVSITKTLAQGTFGGTVTEHHTVWVHPQLVAVRTSDYALHLIVRARRGQTRDEVAAAADAIATAAEAHSVEVSYPTPSTVQFTLVMRQTLATPATANVASTTNAALPIGVIDAGRHLDATPWRLTLSGSHTLVVGCSGSGKGSVLWAAVGGLAPNVHSGVVELWGIGLKGGMELAMGQELFCHSAYDVDGAVATLEHLAGVVRHRTRVMAGRLRTHTPSRDMPLLVLVIDELATITAYCPPEQRKAVTELLSLILSQGRAVGVTVLACVQDPRKDTIPMRGLFTQTIALRLRSASETTMVLGDGEADRAPAHRIHVHHPGTGYVVTDTGNVVMVRANYWSDDHIRATATRFAAPYRRAITAGVPAPVPTTVIPGEVIHDHGPVAAAPARKPRQPRSPRRSRTPTKEAA